MVTETPRCELCRKASTRSTDSVLCQDCAEAISRVMAVDVYEANYYRNRQAQLAQARLFTRAASRSGSMPSSERSESASQRFAWSRCIFERALELNEDTQ